MNRSPSFGRTKPWLLFTERAAAASGTFELTSSNQAAVVQLCRRLDGLPLAIELAAVRTRVLTAEQILDRLTDRFALLTGGGRAALPRQQTLRTTIDWSHDLLTPAEQTLLAAPVRVRRPVHRGRRRVGLCLRRGNGRPGVGRAGGAGRQVAGDQGGRRRRRLLSAARNHARVRRPEVAATPPRRTCSTRATSTTTGPGVSRPRTTRGIGPLEWLQWVELEIDNIRSALQKCLAASDWRRGLEIATSIGYYWVTRGTTESMRWFDELLAAAADSPDVPARAYHFRGWLSMLQIEPEAARPWLARAIAAARASGAARAAVRIAVGGLDRGDTWRETAPPPDGSSTRPRALAAGIAFLSRRDRPDPGPSHPRVLRRTTSTAAKAASSAGARLSRDAGDLYYLSPDAHVSGPGGDAGR